MLRSVVEEASSVAKAIEKAWQNAGKPEEFSVKVFQQAERNLFGFTTKSAKVGIFYNVRHAASSASGRSEGRRNLRQRGNQREQREQRHGQGMSRPGQSRDIRQEPQRGQGGAWSEELIATAEEWLKGSLAALGFDDRSLSTAARGTTLKVCFAAPMGRDEREGKIVLNSFAHLLLEVLRNKHGQRPLRNLRVAVDCANSGPVADEAA